ncbi:MAG: tetratricopeptide repeat protein [Proteobacteria bacterium]|nr:tetratricopeptide repeat protein [Pseudomonadota bacterium]
MSKQDPLERHPRPQGAPPPPPPPGGVRAARADEPTAQGPTTQVTDDDYEDIDPITVDSVTGSGGDARASGATTPGIGAVDLAAPAAPPLARLDPPQLDSEPATIDWAAESAFLVAEALAVGKAQPEHAASLHLAAAQAAEHAGGTVTAQLHAALALAPDCPHVVARARRLLLRQGEIAAATDLAERQLRLGGEHTTRIDALIEAAYTQRPTARASRQSLELLRQALRLDPAHVLALTMTAGLEIELADAQAATTLERLSETLAVPEERALCLYAAGTLNESRPEHRDQAERDYLRAVELDPEGLPALLALAELQLQHERWSQLCATMERLAELALDQAEKHRWLLRAGALQLDRGSDLDAAARNLTRAAALALNDSTALVRLAYVHENAGHHAELVAVLRQLRERTLDAQGRAALSTRIGWLLQTRLGNVQEAASAYRQALEAQPGHLPAVQALGTIYRQRGDFDSLLTLILPETESTDTEQRRALRCIEAAGILAERLGRAAEAATLYQRALDLQPGLPLAFWPLRRLLRRHQRHAELAALLSLQLPYVTDAKLSHDLHLELAQLLAGPLQDPEQAIVTLKQAQALGQSRAAATELAEVYREQGHHAALAQLLLSEAESVEDRDESLTRRLQAASVLEEELGEHERALSIYRDVLQRDPRNSAAFRAIGRLYHRLGRWSELVALLERELTLGQDAQQAAQLWCRIGRIQEEHLGNAAEAIASYVRALGCVADSSVALLALDRLARGADRVPDLVEVLQHYAAARSEPVAAADALCRAAELAEHRLGDSERGLRLYDQALERLPDFMPALFGRYGVQLRRQQLEDAAQTLEQLAALPASARVRTQLDLQLARLRELRLGEAPDLTRHAAAAKAPYGARLRGELLRVYRSTHHPALMRQLIEIGQATLDPALAAAYLAEAAQQLEAAGALEEAQAAAGQALAQQPNERSTAWLLQRVLQRQGRWRELAGLLEQEAEQEGDPAIRLHLLGESASAHLRAQQADDALRVARLALTLNPAHLPTLRLMAHLAALRGDWAERAALHDRQAELCAGMPARLATSLHAAALWELRVGDKTRALKSLQRALSDDPSHAAAFAAAERLLREAEDVQGLSQLYSRRIRATATPNERASLLRAHAWLLRDHLKDPTRAIGELNELLALVPTDVTALAALAELLATQQRWSDAAAALTELVRRSDDPATRQRARLQLAQLRLDRLHELRAARDVLQQALSEDPGDTATQQLLVRVCLVEGSWSQARQLLDALSAHEAATIRVWAFLQLADVARIGLRDEALVEHAEREALADAATEPALLARLITHYRDREEAQRLVALMAATIPTLGATDTAHTLRRATAAVLIDDLRQPARALELLRETLAARPGDVPTQLIAARALEQQGANEAAVLVLRRVLQTEPRSVDGYRGLLRLLPLVGQPIVAAAAGAALELLGVITPSEAARLQVFTEQGSPLGLLDVATLPLDRALQPLDEALAAAAPHLGELYQPGETPLPEAPPSVSSAVQRVAQALGLGTVQVLVGGQLPACGVVGAPLRLVVGAALAREANAARFRFWIGRALVGVASAGALAERLSSAELSDLIAALTEDDPVDPLAQQLRKRVLRALPRRVRKSLESMSLGSTPPSTTARWQSALQERADRVGLLLSGSPQVALAALAEATQPRDKSGFEAPRLLALLRFSVSEEYATLHRALWTARATDT